MNLKRWYETSKRSICVQAATQTIFKSSWMAGAGKANGERPFLRQPAKTSLSVVFSKIPGWAFAWGVGWLAFWTVALIFLAFLVASQQGEIRGQDFVNFTVILLSGGMGGFLGGLLAGLFTMLTLRPNAPSISWKHMSPTIRVWGISGPLGMIISGLVTALMVAIGAITVQGAEPNCSGVSFGDCAGQIIGGALGQAIGLILLILFVFLLFVVIAWFITGMFAGWQVVRHIRRLEPGITTKQGWQVSTGWGCGAIVAAAATMFAIGILSSMFGL